jgi:hypothetical protein
MTFIDIFNFKKYFAKPSDSQVARYGHVNALYTDLKITTGSYDFDIPDGDLTVTTKAGVITLLDDIVSGASVSFNLMHSDITENSVILLTVGSSTGQAVLATCSPVTIAGEVNITLNNLSLTDAENVVIHYLIIN